MTPGLMAMLETCDEKERAVYGYAAGSLAGIPWPDNEAGLRGVFAWWADKKEDPEWNGK